MSTEICAILLKQDNKSLTEFQTIFLTLSFFKKIQMSNSNFLEHDSLHWIITLIFQKAIAENDTETEDTGCKGDGAFCSFEKCIHRIDKLSLVSDHNKPMIFSTYIYASFPSSVQLIKFFWFVS